MNQKPDIVSVHVALLLILLFQFTPRAVLAESPGTPTLWDGVYSEEQVLRGRQVYEPSCQSCHAPDMRGGPAVRGLVGIAFQFLWKDKPLADLYTAMRTKMPPGNPGTLSDQEYIDVLAAILKQNGFPSGGQELKPDTEALQKIPISWENPAGNPPPDSAK